MKKLLVLFLIISFISSAAFSPPKTGATRANATSFTYARVVVSDAAFYADRSLSMPRFFLPESYFVRIISDDLDVCRVAYMDGTSRPVKEGYVKTVCLSFVYEVPAVIYPDVTLSVKTEEVLFSDLTSFTPRAVLSASSSAVYYGETVFGGETYVYVYASGYVGYVRKSGFDPFSVPLLPDYRREEDQTSSIDISSSSSSSEVKSALGADTGKIAVIAAALIAVVSVVFIITRPSKKTADAFYKDDD